MKLKQLKELLGSSGIEVIYDHLDITVEDINKRNLIVREYFYSNKDEIWLQTDEQENDIYIEHSYRAILEYNLHFCATPKEKELKNNKQKLLEYIKEILKNKYNLNKEEYIHSTKNRLTKDYFVEIINPTEREKIRKPFFSITVTIKVINLI